MPEYHETPWDRFDRIMYDWVIPLGGLAVLVSVIIVLSNMVP